MTAGSRVKCIQ